MKSLLVEAYISSTEKSTSFFNLTEEGKAVLVFGSPEVRVFEALKNADGMSIPELQKTLGKDVAKIGMGQDIDGKMLTSLKKRKLLQPITRKSYTIVRGSSYAPQRVKKYADL